MFTPPPEGYDNEEGCLPIKSIATKDGSPEQVPLLTYDEAAQNDSNVPKKSKVRGLISLDLVIVVFFFSLLVSYREFGFK